MSARRTGQRASRAAGGRGAGAKVAGRRWWAIGLGVAAALAVVSIVALPALRPSGDATVGPEGLPGPLGGPDVAQEVNTLVGKPAPAFTLSDSEGTSYTVTPGQGRPLVLISHMGLG